MIIVDHLRKTYGYKCVLDDVCFTVPKGSILGFLGPNGAGKTTTMRIITGYLAATSGTVVVDGEEVHANPMAVKAKIGYLPETPPLYPDMTVREYLGFVSKIKNVPAGERNQRLERVLKACQIEDKADAVIRTLSKGYRQRVGIAQAIVHDPPVIILDEPTVGLDPRQITQVRSLIKSFAGEKTVILSTHILSEVTVTCDSVAIIHRGKIVATGTSEELLSQVQSQLYRLEVDSNPATVLPRLTEIPGVQKLESQPVSASSPRFLIEVAVAGEEVAKDIVSFLVHQGIGIYEMRRVKASLEDIFLQLTTEEHNSS